MNFILTHHRRALGLAVCAALTILPLTACTKKEAAGKKEEQTEKKDENVVTLTKENLDHVQIKTEPAALGGLEISLKAAGRVSENANKTAKIASTLEGRLIKLNFDINDTVKAGNVIGLVQTPELFGKPLELKAPIDGVIIERKSTVGEQVGKDTEIYTIGNLSDLWVIAEIKERDIGQVKIGQEASLVVLAYPHQKFHGKVVRLGNRVEDESRTLEVRIEVSNASGLLKPGMFADVEIITRVHPDVLLIPDTALQTNGEEQIAFVALDDGRFEKRTIKVGMEQHGRVQVLEGIKVGEKVVTTGSFVLKSELLKAALVDED